MKHELSQLSLMEARFLSRFEPVEGWLSFFALDFDDQAFIINFRIFTIYKIRITQNYKQARGEQERVVVKWKI